MCRGTSSSNPSPSSEYVFTRQRDEALHPERPLYAFTELLVERMPGEGIYEFYRGQAEAAAQRSKPQPPQSVPQPGSMEWFKAQKNKG